MESKSKSPLVSNNTSKPRKRCLATEPLSSNSLGQDSLRICRRFKGHEGPHSWEKVVREYYKVASRIPENNLDSTRRTLESLENNQVYPATDSLSPTSSIMREDRLEMTEKPRLTLAEEESEESMPEQKKPGDDAPRKYHLVLSNGEERDITSVFMEVIHNGALKFENANEELVAIYAPGSWLAVEVEARDDRG